MDTKMRSSTRDLYSIGHRRAWEIGNPARGEIACSAVFLASHNSF